MGNDAPNHPCQQFDTQELPVGYGTATFGLGPEASINTVTFVRPLPDPATLTHAERYMVAGLTRRPRGGGMMPPWYEELLSVLHPHAYNGHAIPGQLSDAFLQGVFGEITGENWLPSFLRSPIHGGYPRLDCTEFSPGNVYIHALTPEEMQHLAAYQPTLKALLNDEPLLGRPMRLIEPVYYIRVYGHSGVIANTLSVVYQPR